MMAAFQEFTGIPIETLELCMQQTLYMVALALVIGAVLGMVMALIVVLTRPKGLLENYPIYWFLSTTINIVRSIPFIILIVTVMPLTKLLVGTRVGTTAALIPLVLHSGPYMARLFESSMLEVNNGIIEAAQSMGASIFQIIWYFLIPESKPSLMLALTTGTIGLIGSTAMAGAIGAGGVGNLALMYGYERLNTPLMIVTVVILVLFVQLIQTFGNMVSRRMRHAER